MHSERRCRNLLLKARNGVGFGSEGGLSILRGTSFCHAPTILFFSEKKIIKMCKTLPIYIVSFKAIFASR